jgi:hypothetical protein
VVQSYGLRQFKNRLPSTKLKIFGLVFEINADERESCVLGCGLLGVTECSLLGVNGVIMQKVTITNVCSHESNFM